MLHYLRVLFLRFAVCSVASFAFILVLSQVHDYNQTRQAFHDYNSGDGLMWLIGFYFLNEAGSGIKYALTGNERHLGYFPKAHGDSEIEFDAQRAYRMALLAAENGDWSEQLRLSHLHALGWGVTEDKVEASRWYLRSERRAKELGQYEQWVNHKFRNRVRVFINAEIVMERIAQDLPAVRETDSNLEGF